MSKGVLVRKPYHFPGLTVLIPRQDGDQIVAVNKGSLIPDNISKNTEIFHLIRHIANIVFLTKSDYEKGIMNPVKSFSPPVEFRVAYNFQDLMICKGDPKRLKLAYWNGDQWVVISDSAHGFCILPPSTGQVAEFRIQAWVGDPPLAWGQ